MSSITSNLPASLLKSVENDSSTMTILTESTKKARTTKPKVEKPRCQAARVYRTIELAEADFMKGIEVIIHREQDKTDPTKIKPVAYSRCTVSIGKTGNLCHHHTDGKNVKIFDTDIMPNGVDMNRRKAVMNDEYFQKKGKRGRPEIGKSKKNSIEFTNDNHPVFKILNHSDTTLKIALAQAAFDIIKKYEETRTIEDAASAKMVEPIEFDDESLEVVIKNNGPKKYHKLKAGKIDDIPIAKKTQERQDFHFSNSDDEDGEDEDDVEDVKVQAVKDDEESDDENDEDDEDESEQIEITANNGKIYAYFLTDNEVYDPEIQDEDGSTLHIGGLFEMSDDKYVNIVFQSKKYAILKKIKYGKNSVQLTEYYHCCLTDDVFDMEKNHVGKFVLIEDNKFEIEFNKKKSSKSVKTNKN